jgi:integrase
MSQARRHNFTENYVKRVKPEAAPFNIWDTGMRGLVLRVQPTSHRAFKFVYSFRNRPRWFHIGDTDMGLKEARRLAAKHLSAVAEGRDPLTEHRSRREAGTFGDLADKYLELKAKPENKSWGQARSLVEKYLFPKWRHLEASSITLSDVNTVIDAIRMRAPIQANQVMAAASAIFTWGVKRGMVPTNPVRGVDRSKTTSRARKLEAEHGEYKLFWDALPSVGLLRSAALKMILLTGARPGEVVRMRLEHVRDGWWLLPGKPDRELGWPGTKNGSDHKVWLSSPALDVLSELETYGGSAGYAFAGPSGRPVNGLSEAMKNIVRTTGMEAIRPHDLRRSFASTVTKLKLGRDAMDRLLNHKPANRDVTNTYDRTDYSDEDRKAWEKVAARVITLVAAGNVVSLRQARVAPEIARTS